MSGRRRIDKLRKLLFHDDIEIRFWNENISEKDFLKGRIVYMDVLNEKAYDELALLLSRMGAEIAGKELQIDGSQENECIMVIMREIESNEIINDTILTAMQEKMKSLYFKNQMFAQKCIQQNVPGRIVNIFISEDVDDLFAKKTLERMIGGMAKTLGPHRIRINGIFINSDSFRQLESSVVFFLSNYSDYITGICLNIGKADNESKPVA